MNPITQKYYDLYIKDGYHVTWKPVAMKLPAQLRKLKVEFDLYAVPKNKENKKNIVFIECGWNSPSIEKLSKIAAVVEKIEDFNLDISGPFWKTILNNRLYYKELNSQLDLELKIFSLIEETYSPIKKFIVKEYGISQNEKKIKTIHFNSKIQDYSINSLENYYGLIFSLREKLNKVFETVSLNYLLEYSDLKPHFLFPLAIEQLENFNIISYKDLLALKQYYLPKVPDCYTRTSKVILFNEEQKEHFNTSIFRLQLSAIKTMAEAMKTKKKTNGA